jgi:hypothetical protein
MSIQEQDVCECCGQDMRHQEIGNLSASFREYDHLVCKICVSWSQGESDTAKIICPLCKGLGFTLGDHCQKTNAPEPYAPSSKVIALLKNLRASREEPEGSPIKRHVPVHQCWYNG